MDKFGEAQPLKEGSSVCRYCYCEVKQWVGMTEGEKDKYFLDDWASYDRYHGCFREVMRWQEKILKEKNGG